MDALRMETLLEVAQEAKRAVMKHGLERSALSPSLHPGERLAILGEEYGEVCHELTYDGAAGLGALRKELLQVANVAACWAQVIGDLLSPPAHPEPSEIR